jgi:penicillin-binding protein 1A
VLEPIPKKVVAVLQSGESITDHRRRPEAGHLGPVAQGQPEDADPPGAVIRVVQDAQGRLEITQLPEVEGAFVALDPRDGAIRALVGGFDFNKNKFNHVTQAWRQPGSSFKPFIYSAALEKGFTPATVINDAPLFFDAGVDRQPALGAEELRRQVRRPDDAAHALAKSKNMVSIRILQSIGPAYAQDWITRFGFDADKHPAYLTMALGAGSVTPLQMASAYACSPTAATASTPADHQDHRPRARLLNEASRRCSTNRCARIDARNAFMMDSLLQEVTRAAPPRARRHAQAPRLYGKTGTTNDSIDAWFAGFQPTLVAVVWIGYDNPRKLGDRETGGGLSLPVWIDYMKHALKGVPVRSPRRPKAWSTSAASGTTRSTRTAGVSSLGLEDKLPTAAADEDERKSILDLFKRGRSRLAALVGVRAARMEGCSRSAG